MEWMNRNKIITCRMLCRNMEFEGRRSDELWTRKLDSMIEYVYKECTNGYNPTPASFRVVMSAHEPLSLNLCNSVVDLTNIFSWCCPGDERPALSPRKWRHRSIDYRILVLYTEMYVHVFNILTLSHCFSHKCIYYHVIFPDVHISLRSIVLQIMMKLDIAYRKKRFT